MDITLCTEMGVVAQGSALMRVQIEQEVTALRSIQGKWEMHLGTAARSRVVARWLFLSSIANKLGFCYAPLESP